MVVISLTTIPPRFKYIQRIVCDLLKLTVDRVYVSIPLEYTRFPGTFEVPVFDDPRVTVLRPERDDGPATKFIAPALVVDDDQLIIYVDDDTHYPPNLVETLVSARESDPKAVWGLAGFRFDEYFEDRSSFVDGRTVDVIEGFAGVIIDAPLIKDHLDEIRDLLKLTYNDDLVLSNVLNRLKVPMKTVCSKECHIGLVNQYNFGMLEDALHYNNGERTHVHNNKRILKAFTEAGKNYFSA
jgi:hypothetical protein